MTWNSYPYFPTQDLTSLNCPLSPMPHLLGWSSLGTHCHMVPCGQWYFGWEGDTIFWSNWSQHPLWCMSSTGFHAKLEGWHCSCVCGWAPEPLSLYPECLHLPHGNSPFGFLSKPSVCMGVLWSPEHSAIPSILQSSLLFLSKTTLPPIAPKALCTSLHINRCSKFDRWTINSTTSQPPDPIRISATTPCNVNFQIPDVLSYFTPCGKPCVSILRLKKIQSRWLWGRVLALSSFWLIHSCL